MSRAATKHEASIASHSCTAVTQSAKDLVKAGLVNEQRKAAIIALNNYSHLCIKVQNLEMSDMPKAFLWNNEDDR